MIKLKNILNENNEVIDLRKFKDNCKHFISLNRSFLLRDLGLIRQEDIEVESLEKFTFRKRKRIKGNPIKFYYYEKYKPSGAPSRLDILPSYGLRANSDYNNMFGRNFYYVFPIGTNYKLTFFKGLIDFNHMGNEISPSDKRYKKSIRSKLHNLKSMYNSLNTEGDSINLDTMALRDPDEIYKTYKTFEDKLKSAEYNSPDEDHTGEEFKQIILRVLREIEDIYRTFMSGYVETQKIVDAMAMIEVDIYAPDGYYYIAEDYFKQNKENILGD